MKRLLMITCAAAVGMAADLSTFRSTGGVNGHLELRFPKSKVADVYVTTAKDLKTFTVHVAGGEEFGYAISDGGKVMAQGRASGDFTLPADGYEFWSHGEWFLRKKENRA